MAKRPVFVPISLGNCSFVDERFFEFVWNAGFAPVQKKKNIKALHKAAEKSGYSPLLEVSTKSDEEIGRRLSAFHLEIESDGCGRIPLESAYQGSKVFEKGGPYTDLYEVDARSAKRDQRLKGSGPLVGFDFEGIEFGLEPKTAFYDWLYISAIYPHRDWLKCLYRYMGFTDIEFNPKKSLNCQARSCALFVSLMKRQHLDSAVSSKSTFLDILAGKTTSPGREESHLSVETLQLPLDL